MELASEEAAHATAATTATTSMAEDGDDVEQLLEHLSRQAELFLRHQRRSDPDMSPEERLLLLRVQLEEDPGDFLARYHRHVPPELLGCLQRRWPPPSAAEAEEAARHRYYLAEIRRSSRPARRKNRRYQAMQRLVAAGEYFSDESMRHREPYLYHKYVGRYETAPESAAAAAAAAAGQRDPDRVMSHFLMRHCDRVDENARFDAAAAATDAAGSASEDDDEEEEEADEDEAGGATFLPERERQLLRAEFTSIMHRRFLAGEDAAYFDYASVDCDDSLDVSDQFQQDQEESYFDSEEPS